MGAPRGNKNATGKHRAFTKGGGKGVKKQTGGFGGPKKPSRGSTVAKGAAIAAAGYVGHHVLGRVAGAAFTAALRLHPAGRLALGLAGAAKAASFGVKRRKR